MGQTAETVDSKQAQLSLEQVSSTEDAWGHVKKLPCTLSVEVPIPAFTVGKLLALVPGMVLDSWCEEGSHVPVLTNGQMIGWGEFDVVDDVLAIRLTELA